MKNRIKEQLRSPFGIALVLAVCLLASPAAAADAAEQEEDAQRQEESGEQGSSNEEQASVSERLNYSEQVVVSASRIEQEIVNAPTAVTVLGPDQIETRASSDFGDLIRRAPGMNVVQMSNRDVNVTSRGATGALAASQLVLMDGRAVYQDFFGFVPWDLISVGMDHLERVEVVNGPVSAVWGANAMNGVVNLITRAPRDSEGTTLDLEFGTFDRSVPGRDMDAGTTMSGTLNHAQVLSDTLAYRLSVGFRQTDAFARPMGEIPNGFGVMYPPFDGLDSGGPKLDLRVDWDAPDRSSAVRISGGYSATQGVLHSGLGPFSVNPGAGMGYGRVQYIRGSTEIDAYVNSTGMEFNTLLVEGPDGNLIESDLQSNTFDLTLRDTRFLGERQLLSYGASARHITLDSGLAVSNDGRTDLGAYVHDEIFLSDQVRWIVGARADRISTLDDVVFSPRTTLIFKPIPTQAFRVSYNQAFRAPSLANSYIHAETSSAVVFDLRPAFRSFFPSVALPDEALPAPVPFRVPFAAVGNRNLLPEKLTAWEAGWSGAINDSVGATISVYRNRTENAVNFGGNTFWSGTNAPAGWNEAFAPTAAFIRELEALLPEGALPEAVAAVGRNPAYLIDLLASLGGQPVPETFTYRNSGFITNVGIETGLTFRHGDFGGFLNYSWQADPGYDDDVWGDLMPWNIPPTHRVNAGLDGHFGRLHLGATVNHATRAYWADVFAAEFHGWTEGYTMLNASATVDFYGGRVRPTVRVLNLLNQDMQQHIFADIMKRQIIGELHLAF